MIDYSLIDEKKITERLRLIPRTIEGLLNSEETQKTIQRIGREHFLDEERVNTLKQLAGLVLLGFVSQEELSREISDNLPLNQIHSRQLAEELGGAIFDPVKRDLERIYEPVIEPRPEEMVSPKTTEVKELEKETISLEEIGRESFGPATKIEVKKIENGDKPLIIHREEKEETATEEAKKPFRGFDFPFKFFKTKEVLTETPVKAKIETPASAKAPAGKPVPKRVVHYSELRTPLTPFEKTEDEIINLETLTKKEPIKPSVQSQKESSLSGTNEEKDEGPKLEGNIIDLS